MEKIVKKIVILRDEDILYLENAKNLLILNPSLFNDIRTEVLTIQNIINQYNKAEDINDI